MLFHVVQPIASNTVGNGK